MRCVPNPVHMCIWMYLEYAYMKLRNSSPVVASIIWSILGKEKLSFGYALLRSMKSCALSSLHYFSSLGRVSNQLRIFGFSDKHFYISLFRASYFSEFKRHRLYCFGRIEGSVFKLIINFRVNFCHVFMTPSENIKVLLEELYYLSLD